MKNMSGDGQFSFQLKAALLGDWDKELAQGRKRVEYAAKEAMKEAGGVLKAKLQADVMASGMADNRPHRLAKTWQARFYPNNGYNAAALIYSKAPLIIEAFERGSEVRSSKGKWLAIPNPELGFKMPRGWARTKGRRNIIEAYAAKFGRLTFVPTKRRNLALLVADLRQTRSGAYASPTEASRRHGRTKSIVVFYLVPSVRLPRLLKGETIRARFERDFPTMFQKRFDYHLAVAERGELAPTGPSGGVEQ